MRFYSAHILASVAYFAYRTSCITLHFTHYTDHDGHAQVEQADVARVVLVCVAGVGRCEIYGVKARLPVIRSQHDNLLQQRLLPLQRDRRDLGGGPRPGRVKWVCQPVWGTCLRSIVGFRIDKHLRTDAPRDHQAVLTPTGSPQ